MKNYAKLAKSDEQKLLSNLLPRRMLRPRQKVFWRIDTEPVCFELVAIGRIPCGIDVTEKKGSKWLFYFIYNFFILNPSQSHYHSPFYLSTIHMTYSSMRNMNASLANIESLQKPSPEEVQSLKPFKSTGTMLSTGSKLTVLTSNNLVLLYKLPLRRVSL